MGTRMLFLGVFGGVDCVSPLWTDRMDGFCWTALLRILCSGSPLPLSIDFLPRMGTGMFFLGVFWSWFYQPSLVIQEG